MTHITYYPPVGRDVTAWITPEMIIKSMNCFVKVHACNDNEDLATMALEDIEKRLFNIRDQIERLLSK